MKVAAQEPRSVPCKLAILAEAPGQEEIEKGGLYLTLAREIWPELPWTGETLKDRALAGGKPALPLVGPSGRLFNGALRAAGIDRRDCWVGNLFEEKAPKNDVEPWLRDPERLGPAMERLSAELVRAQPTVIVALGATALWALCEISEIGKVRGSPLKATRLLPGTKVIPTYHPAAILRTYKHFPLLIGDLVKAVAEAEKGPELVYPWREFTLEPSLEEVRRWVWPELNWGLQDSRGENFPSLLDSDLLSVDIETGWGQITCIGFAPDHEHAICIPFVDLRKPSRSYWATVEEELEAWRLVKAVLESPVPKLGQNFGGYDAYWLLKKKGVRPMNYREDTRLMHHALYPELPKDLASLAAAYSELPSWKHWNKGSEDKRDS